MWDFHDILKLRVAVHKTQNHKSLLRRAPNTDFPDLIKFCVAVHTLWEKAIRFRHPDYDADRAQKLISSSMSLHLSTRKMSSKSMHAFLSDLANRQTSRAIAFTGTPTTSVVRDSEVNKIRVFRVFTYIRLIRMDHTVGLSYSSHIHWYRKLDIVSRFIIHLTWYWYRPNP